ncbi:MAG: DegT/DnrJ/EryC1/StrS family aminotransferase [Parvularculaceae bacterium]|nr:DegT/DnrJ/EryC1/StrS family aminotransferase [Parvularculaceae bacterium]
MFRRIQSKWPVYEEDEITAVAKVLRSGRVNSLQHGEQCRSFEKAFAESCGMPFGISLANGTLALELALRALGVGLGDEVVVTSRSFVASASCVINAGATPIFADVDPDSQNLTAESVRAVLTDKTRAIILVHLAGYSSDMDDLCALTAEKGLKLIEDCAQAHGASYKARPVGSFGDAAAFSFCTDKIMSTGGEGGMLLLRNEDVFLRAWSYKDHGKNYALAMEKSSEPQFRWMIGSIGTNFRMTEMQAAIGLLQLAKLKHWVEERRQRARILDEIFADLRVFRIPAPRNDIGHSYYKYYMFVRPERLREGWTRDRILREASALGAPCGPGSCPEIYREKAFADGQGSGRQRFPIAMRLGETSILLPVDQTLSHADVREMGNILRYVALQATA